MTLGVHDEGIGIRPELLPRIFSPYFRGDPGKRAGRLGLGLGLAITRYFVTQYGGSIEAQSRGPGLGSDFTVRLPAIARRD
jgi:signal transduction histidine kinase